MRPTVFAGLMLGDDSSLTVVAGLAARWLTFAGILLAVGAPVFRLLVVGRAGQGDSAASRTAAWVGAIAAGLVLPAAAVRLVIQTAEMRFPDDPWMGVAKRMVLETPWGSAWLAQTAIGLTLVVAFLGARRAGKAWWAATGLLGFALAATVSISSHARSAEHLAKVAVLADWIHIVVAGTWLGTLGVMFASVRRGDGAPAAPSDYLVALLRAFSPIALVSAALVAGSGVVSSLAHIDDVSMLGSTRYGRALVWKLVAVLIVVLLGWRNWKYGTPAIAKQGTTSVRRGMAAELVAAAIVLLLTAALVVTPPPGEDLPT